MKTATSKKDKRAAWIQRRRDNHHKALETIQGGEIPGLKLWRRLRRLERQATSLSERLCGDSNYSYEQWEIDKERIRARAAAIFGGSLPSGFYLNSDPRGYALKIDPEKAPIPAGMETDWGGYGILAAEID